ncbi:MAG TPA: RDD family protein [Terriglobales bacterium]
MYSAVCPKLRQRDIRMPPFLPEKLFLFCKREMKNRFIPESANHPPQLVGDPDSYDASEEQFAASLEAESAAVPQPFIVDKDGEPGQERKALSAGSTPVAEETDITPSGDLSAPNADPTALQPELQLSDEAWRREVSDRLSRYRARKRTRSPRYPSLQLKFEVPAVANSHFEEQPAPRPISPTLLAVAIDETVIHEDPAIEREIASEAAAEKPHTDSGAKIIEFPRFFTAPAAAADELAAPVSTGPRILEVPEQMPPPPALGGILIEPEIDPTGERRAGFELPLNPPAMSRRVAAGVIDFCIISISFAAFAVMFYRVTHIIPGFKQSVGVCGVIIAALWMVYEYLFLVYPGATPGLRLTQLQLARFDGTLAPRSLRRWRVLASILSALSLTLGYIWCFFDEDRLCWHDRITHTYMALPPRPLAADHLSTSSSSTPRLC